MCALTAPVTAPSVTGPVVQIFHPPHPGHLQAAAGGHSTLNFDVDCPRQAPRIVNTHTERMGEDRKQEKGKQEAEEE